MSDSDSISLFFFFGYFLPEKNPDIFKAIHSFGALVHYAPGKRQVQKITIPDINAYIKNIKKVSIFRIYVFEFGITHRVPPGGEDPKNVS
jgi:hypothetical protein